MKTKCTVLGSKEELELHPIIFMRYLNTVTKKWDSNIPFDVMPNNWKNIELIAKDYTEGMDIMFAYDDIRNRGVLMLGYWNDGFVKTLENEAI